MKKIIALVMVGVWIATPAFAQSMRKHTDRKAKFSIDHPSNWQKTLNKEGVNFTVKSKDNLANVQVMAAAVEADTSTVYFLSEVEKAASEQHINRIPEENRVVATDDLTAMNVDEGAIGAYILDYDGTKIKQLIMALRKNATMYTIIVTFAEVGEEQYKDIAQRIGDSFKAL
ncbi:MAG TPA: PsbP-related protein [Turneriella sp.]|nr:PsbP-related protein [Turneriella sp.]